MFSSNTGRPQARRVRTCFLNPVSARSGSMTLISKDMTPVYKSTIAKGTSATRWQKAAYVDHLPPCNNGCPAGLNIQAWLALAQAGKWGDAWRQYMEGNPLSRAHRPAYRLPREGLAKEIARIEAMGVKIVRNHRVTDVLAEKEQGRFDAVFLGIGTQLANHLNVPAMDGGKMIDAISLLEQVEEGRAPVLGRVVGIVGGGHTAMDAARTAKRLGAEEAVLIFRSDTDHLTAHPYEAMEAMAEGVKIKWLSTVKQFGQDEVLVERMET